MGDKMIDPFNLLLNKISNELTEKQLRSLIHICANIPDGHKDKMQDGLALFKYLKDINVISKEKVGNLRKLVSKVLPKRRDIVCLVDEYIKKEYQTDNVRFVLDDLSLSQSQEELLNYSTMLDHGAAQPVSPKFVFNVNNQYMYYGCRKFPSCYIMSIIILSLGIIITCLLWYTDFPKINKQINRDQDLKKAGTYIISFECLFLVVLIVLYVWKKSSHAHRFGYVSFVNPTRPTVQKESAKNSGPTVLEEAEAQGRDISAPMACPKSYGAAACPVSSDGISLGFNVSLAETV